MIAMKKGFTLVELLIVVVVLVTLMTMVFRLGNIGGESEKRAITIQRMQRLEMALSGYYAAFGMYPPVKDHGSRDIYHGLDGNDNQNIWNWISGDGTEVTNGQLERNAWSQVKAACEVQPVSCEFPFAQGYEAVVLAASEELKIWARESQKMPDNIKEIAESGFDDGATGSGNTQRFTNRDETDWSEVKVFKFGLLSYLLPRYLIMLDSNQTFYGFEQWRVNNDAFSDPFTGDVTDVNGQSYWQGVQQKMSNNGANRNEQLVKMKNIPSQLACARWMACFEKTLSCNYDRVLYGVHIQADSAMTIPTWYEDGGYMTGHVYRPGGEDSNSKDFYVLDCITIRDGWGNDLYYNSPAPYQNYTVWSAGANGRTFPPWVAREKLPANAQKCVGYWTKDDIVNLKN